MCKSVLFWISLIVLFLAGCGPKTVASAQPESEKLTLQNLKPPDAQTFLSQIVFDVVTFEVPVDKVRDIASVMAPFNSVQIKFHSRELFEKNGLRVYYGRGDDGDKLIFQLRLLNARHTLRTSLTTMDKADELITKTIFSAQRHVFSTLYGDRQIGQTYRPGQIGWVITPSLSVRRDAIEMEIVPAYVPADGTHIRIAAGRKELGQQAFAQGRMELMMQEGDFLILAPGRVSVESTLDSLLFGPDETHNQVRLYILHFKRAN